ncbi:alpha/beta hydrolase [Rhodoferax sp.]|uniref:alpha/beta hydrolase n=1 Tax=Rhodoferax sp. TaxID=50421 RepID=UPI0025F16AA7|nr:alpha/beta hydrolase [Rhodoferax sp.]
MSTIVFSHANSFPASTYKVLFKSLRARGYSVKAVEKYGHDPRYPVSNNWPHVVQQLVDHATKVVDKAGEPVWLVGHSLGGFLSLMAAAQQPALAKGVVLIDSPLVGGWRSRMVGLAKTTQLVGSISPGAVSRKRRNSWPDTDAALTHFQHKKAFARWDPQVLQDYVDEFPEDSEGRRVLAFDRDVETAFYNTLPDNMDRLLARHPVKCPVTFIGGDQSAEMKQVGMDLTHKVSRGRIMMLDGTHLFPMEKPLATAAALEAALRNMEH